MVTRIRIGLIYLFDKHWLGGLYYAQNLVYALGTLDDDKRPEIDVYCYTDEAYHELKKNTGYPYLNKHIIHNVDWKRKLKNILFLISRRWAYSIDLFEIMPEDQVVFPFNWGSHVKKLIHWVPDFQDKYYPHYFSKIDRYKREQSIKQTCKRGIPIVFSSNDCLNDFKKFYPDYTGHPTHVVHFAVHQPDFSQLHIENIKVQFHINSDYLFCANQFWEHKNHLSLFKAFKKAVDNGLPLQLVCTGNFEGSRNPQYIEEIKKYIIDNHLENRILLLGVIDKLEMLCLMKHSHAVVQPSLFEGWNTTVEDCKCMNKFLFLSDLNVHREQINRNVCFFNPSDIDDLAEKLLSVTPVEQPVDYSQNIRDFALNFYSVIKNHPC